MPKFTILEVADTEAKVFQASRVKKGGLTIESAFVVDFADLGRDEAGVVERGVRLREALKRNKVSQTEAAILIQKQNSIVRTAVLPSGDPTELAEMARFEAEKFIPFNADRHIVSEGVLHLDEINGSHVLITAVDRPVIDQTLALLNGTNLEPVLAEVTSISLARAFTYYDPDRPAIERTAKKQGEDEPGDHHEEHERCTTLLLNIGLGQTEISILEEGMLITARSLGTGLTKLLRDLQKAMHLDRALTLEDLAGLDLGDPDAFLLDGGATAESELDPGKTKVGDKVRNWVGQITRFVRQTYEYASREHDIPAKTRIWLCGDAVALGRLDRLVGQHLAVETRIFNPLADFPTTGKGHVDRSCLPGMVSPLGSAVRLFEQDHDPSSAEGRVNLLPAEVLEARAAGERKVLLVLSAVMVLITGAMLYLAWDERVAHARELDSSYRSHNRKMAPVVESIEQKRTQLNIIESIRTGRAPALYVLDQLATFSGMGSTLDGGRLVLTEYRYSPRDEVTISGDALSVEDISSFHSFLEGLEYQGNPVFSRVGLPANQARELSRGRPNIWVFSINATLYNTHANDDGRRR